MLENTRNIMKIHENTKNTCKCWKIHEICLKYLKYAVHLIADFTFINKQGKFAGKQLPFGKQTHFPSIPADVVQLANFPKETNF